MKKAIYNFNIIFTIIFFTVFLLICQLGICQPENKSIIKIKLDFEAKPAKMSNIFSKVFYIPLETSPKCLIGYMSIPVFEKYIITISSGDIGDANIFLYSDNGKFLNKIGNSGRGPEEYQNISDVVLIGDTIYVVSNNTNDIICYSLSGVFLTKYHVATKARMKSITKLSDGSFMISLSSNDILGNIIKTDRNFNIKTGFKINVPLDYTAVPFKFQRSINEIFYYNNYIDTIFEISSGYPTPSIVIDYGKYKTKSQKLSINERESTILNRPRILDFSASYEYSLLNLWYPYLNSIYTALYRKNDGKQIMWTKLINDIDEGTLDRWPGFLTGENIIFWLMPSTVLDRFSKMTDSQKSDPKNSEFVKMASNLKLESNPVLMICKLK